MLGEKLKDVFPRVIIKWNVKGHYETWVKATLNYASHSAWFSLKAFKVCCQYDNNSMWARGNTRWKEKGKKKERKREPRSPLMQCRLATNNKLMSTSPVSLWSTCINGYWKDQRGKTCHFGEAGGLFFWTAGSLLEDRSGCFASFNFLTYIF